MFPLPLATEISEGPSGYRFDVIVVVEVVPHGYAKPEPVFSRTYPTSDVRDVTMPTAGSPTSPPRCGQR